MRIITFLRKCAHIHLESILAHVNLLGLEDRLALDLSSSHEKNDADGDVKMVRGTRAVLASERHGS